MELTFVSALFDIKVGAVADLVVPSESLTDGELQRLVTLSLPEAGAAGGGEEGSHGVGPDGTHDTIYCFRVRADPSADSGAGATAGLSRASYDRQITSQASTCAATDEAKGNAGIDVDDGRSTNPRRRRVLPHWSRRRRQAEREQRRHHQEQCKRAEEEQQQHRQRQEWRRRRRRWRRQQHDWLYAVVFFRRERAPHLPRGFRQSSLIAVARGHTNVVSKPRTNV